MDLNPSASNKLPFWTLIKLHFLTFKLDLDSNPAPTSATITKIGLVLEHTFLEWFSSDFH